LRDFNLSTSGDRKTLERRDTEWRLLWNANCDRANPKSAEQLREELQIWEETNGSNGFSRSGAPVTHRTSAWAVGSSGGHVDTPAASEELQKYDILFLILILFLFSLIHFLYPTIFLMIREFKHRSSKLSISNEIALTFFFLSFFLYQKRIVLNLMIWLIKLKLEKL